jgi:hypothetical protein
MELTKNDLERILETRLAGLAKTSDIEELRTHIDASIHGLQNELQGFRKEAQDGFAGVDIKLSAIHELIDVRERLLVLEQQVAELQRDAQPSK